MAEQYALDGFVVLAPDVFWQQQRRLDIGYTPDDVQRGRALAMAADRAALQRDLADAVTHLRARPEVQGRGIGAIGYCLGGRLAYVAAATAGVDAAVAYYGGGIQDMLDLAPKITCPMQFHYGELDANIPPAAVEQVRTAMQGKPAEVFVYEQAEHGFNCWARGTYQAAAPRWRTAARFSSWPRICSELQQRRQPLQRDHGKEAQAGQHGPLQHDQPALLPHRLLGADVHREAQQRCQQQGAEHQPEDHHAGTSSAKRFGAWATSSKVTVS